MMLLQDVATTIPLLDKDSVKEETMKVIQMAHDDPSAFWTSFGEQALHFGLKVLAALIVYIVGIWLIRRIKNVLTRIFEKRKTEATLASFVSSFVSIMLMIILVIITVSTLGVDTTSLAALLAAGGMAIGMALSGTVQNFAGGIMLLVFKPFKVGDYIEAQGKAGTVQDVSIVSTKILTVDNQVVVLPNGTLSNGTINNYSTKPLRRVDWSVSVEYGTDAQLFVKTVTDMLLEDDRILTSKYETDEPVADPFVALISLNQNDITFTVRAWTKSENYWGVFFDFQQRLYTELPKRGFNFDYPHCDVTILNK